MVKLPARRRHKVSQFSSWSKNWIKLTKNTLVYLMIKMIFSGLLLVLAFFIVREIIDSLKYSQWDGNSQINLAIESNDHLSYVRINEQIGDILILRFPKNAMITVGQGYGDYQAGKVKALARQEKLAFGSFLEESMTLTLGSMTDAYIINSKTDPQDLMRLLVLTMFKQTKTSLTSWDLVRLIVLVNNMRVEQVRTYDIAKLAAFSLQTQIDGTQVYQADPQLFDNWVLKELARPEFLQLDTRWEVLNATDHQGLGQTAKRILANSGFSVVNVRQALEPQIHSEVIVRTTTVSAAIYQFCHYFQLPLKIEKSKGATADITFVIGENFWQRYFTRNNYD